MKLIICPDCGEEKQYYAKNLCSSCYRRKYYSEHMPREREYWAKNGPKSGRKLKLEIVNHYSNGKMNCACCSEAHIDFLSIDHINGDGAEHRKEIGKSGKSFYLWLKRNNYPEGFRVLCMNCNFSRGHVGYCPHEKEVQEIS